MAHKPGHKFKSPAEFEKERGRTERISRENILQGIENIQNMNREQVHLALAAAGMTPGIGIAADFADMVLYASEGRYGESALSSVAMLPIVGQLSTNYKLLRAAEATNQGMISFYRIVPNMAESKLIKNIDNGRGKKMTHVGSTYNSPKRDRDWYWRYGKIDGKTYHYEFDLNNPDVYGRTFIQKQRTMEHYKGIQGRLHTSTNPRVWEAYFQKYLKLSRNERMLRGIPNPDMGHIVIRYDMPMEELSRLRLRYNPRALKDYGRIVTPGIITNDHLLRTLWRLPKSRKLQQGTDLRHSGGIGRPKEYTIFEDGIPEEFVARVWYGDYKIFKGIPELNPPKPDIFDKHLMKSSSGKMIDISTSSGLVTHHNPTLKRWLLNSGKNVDELGEQLIKQHGDIHGIDITRNELKPWRNVR